MNTEMDRLKQDIQTIEQALGCAPEFGRGTVWASVGWGICGVTLIAMAILHFTFSSRWVGAVVMVTLWLGLPHLFSRLATRFASQQTFGSTRTFGSAKDLSSTPLSGVLISLLLGMMFWMNKMMVPTGLFPALTCLLGGAGCLVFAWGKPWRLGLLIWSLAFIALGFAFPFLPEGTSSLAMGAAIAFAGFTGAVILNRQLNAYYAHGKIAH